MKKIFCIGLPRTGSTSLHMALVMHGISSIHRPIGMAYEMFQGCIPSSFIDRYDAFSDLPIPIYHRELKKEFPESLFILTERDESEWINSISTFLSSRSPPSNQTIIRDMLRLAMFGKISFEEKRFKHVFRKHHEEVLESFSDTPNRLLRINLSDKNALAKLTNFLNLKPRFGNLPRLREPNLGKYCAVDKSQIYNTSLQLLSCYKNNGETFEKLNLHQSLIS